MPMTSKCDTAQVELEVTQGTGQFAYPAVEGTEPVRIGPVPTPFVLHVMTDNPDFDCPVLDIQRVLECPNGCEFDEYKWSFPCECTTAYLLPAGTYDINICKQEVFLNLGDIVTVTFLVEPVTDSFAAIYSAKVKQ